MNETLYWADWIAELRTGAVEGARLIADARRQKAGRNAGLTGRSQRNG